MITVFRCLEILFKCLQAGFQSKFYHETQTVNLLLECLVFWTVLTQNFRVVDPWRKESVRSVNVRANKNTSFWLHCCCGLSILPNKLFLLSQNWWWINNMKQLFQHHSMESKLVGWMPATRTKKMEKQSNDDCLSLQFCKTKWTIQHWLLWIYVKSIVKKQTITNKINNLDDDRFGLQLCSC